ncbi:hypothetical protein BBF96_14800 [Anoxybacter fermentans]|uniref:PqqD family protein n=1 Tax=Anoxybacter fermentans TaxID=1323375 RepID=A0A3S9T1R1_9FIRM|nr:PqqD family protein [Anoxybacter fermentans]AZR74543.1 hypothetical protein BBF96_14800 [Anoxybacter fermentans]
MGILVLKTNGDILRIRKESFGCVIFNRDRYVEGNETAYKIFETLEKVNYNVDQLIQTLLREYQVEENVLIKDLINFFDKFQQVGWFTDIYDELERREVNV